MAIRFEQPALLLLALAAIPIVLLGWRAMRGFDRLRRAVVLLIRAALIALVAGLLAGPHMIQTNDRVTVVGVLDVSGSVRRFARFPEVPDVATRTNMEYLRWWFREATNTRAPDDRFGLIVFDGKAAMVSAPSRQPHNDDAIDLHLADGTNIEEAIQLALAVLPADTARRVVLVSDGNQTAGDAMAAARLAAGRSDALKRTEDEQRSRQTGVPIDVAPVLYAVERDVQVARVEVPARARPGQIVTARIVVESIQPTRGWLTLNREGRMVDINGPQQEGARRLISVPAGQSVHLVDVLLEDRPVNRFEASFEAVNAADDPYPEDNTARAFVATPGKGRVLLVQQPDALQDDSLAAALRANDILVEAVTSSLVTDDLLALQSYDLIILDNIAAGEFDESMQTKLAQYVNDLGGGMIMVGGEQSFGAGGWNGTPVEDVLPVELDLPRELRLTQAALVLVLDRSGSMAEYVAGTRRTKQQIANNGAAAAVESLQKESQVGVVTFTSSPTTWVPLGPNETPRETAERIRSISPGGGTQIGPALARARDMLEQSNARRKFVVLLTDGQSEFPEDPHAIARDMAEQGIVLSTIAVGNDADDGLLRELAEIGGGEFYFVLNPASLPRVLVDSVKVVNQPLIREVTFQPVVRSATGPAALVIDAPPLEGYVLTAQREDPRVVIDMLGPEGEPLLARWQAGLGRVAAFTSDSGIRWATRWRDWSGYVSFWAQLVRETARSPESSEFELDARVERDTLLISLDAVNRDAGYLDYLIASGTVYDPNGRAREVRLEQTGPGHYEARVHAEASGNYVIAITPRTGTRVMAPIIGGATIPEGVEFRRTRSQPSLLQRIAEETGGRIIDMANPRAIDLFDRSGLAPSTSLLPAWQTWLWWLVGLLLLDIASRRIAWDLATLKWAARAALARVTPARVKGQQARATLSALRQRSETVDEGLAREGEGFTKLKGDSRLRHLTPEEKRARRGQTQDKEASVQQALDALAGRTSGAPAAPKVEQPAAASPENPTPQPDVESDEPESTTSGLLAAKRRLRRTLDEEEH